MAPTKSSGDGLGNMSAKENSVNRNPNDSLQNYFDDLLLGPGLDELETAVNSSVTAASPLSAALPISASATTKKTLSETHFSEPNLQQKQNLQKLLHSVQPKIDLSVSEAVTTAPLKTYIPDALEIQEWDIATVLPEIVTSTAIDTVSITEKHSHLTSVDWLANGLPPWAQTRFDVLLVKVSGLSLAVPLISLGQIQPITDELTPIFGQADWFIGIQPTHMGQIRIVNTAKFVMPERYDENFVKTAKLLISINGVPWGLAVDSVKQPISLEPDAIKWRTDRSKRPWLAGIIKEEMCVLLDIPTMGQILMESDKNLSKNPN